MWTYVEAFPMNNYLIIEVIEMLTTILWTLLLANFSVPVGGFFGGRYVPVYVFLAKMVKEGWEEMKANQAKPPAPSPSQQPGTTDSL